MIFHVSSVIHLLAGRSLGGGELHPAGVPRMLHHAACVGPGVGRWGIVASTFGIASFPPPPLHKLRRPELDDQSSSEASGRFLVEIFYGRFPFPRSSRTRRRPISPSSSSSTPVSPSVDRSVRTCRPVPWHPPAQQSSPLALCAGHKDQGSGCRPEWDEPPQDTCARLLRHTSMLPDQRVGCSTPRQKIGLTQQSNAKK